MKNVADNPNTDTTKAALSKVKTIRPDWAAPSNIHVFTSTRAGGVSEAPYNAMNIGSSVNDNPKHVQRNRALLVEAINAPQTPHWLNQVHGRDVAFIDCYHQKENVLEADGSFTREANQVLAVSTADCLPVVITNETGTAVSVIHAGWRGLADGVLQSGLAHFSEEDELHAWLGPAIGPDAFEVGTDVVDAFLARDKHNAKAFKPAGGNKFMADIYALARLSLQQYRRVSITGGEYCTYSQPELFHSYRRDGKASGRMATLVWIA